ncbi:DUF4913 domain-containing protein [Nocardia sp. NPDC050710]|uniref:DUF4913 domain-containing protein n=1 Tax=Nocardia sp. NPDC050710 TaxID=3157220 RepID=UPI0033FEF013
MSEQQRSLVYANVVEFVENYLSLVYRRQVNDLSDTVWCPEWWKHAEAVARLDALWRAWEYYRLDGRTGLSVWFLDHADPHIRSLIDQRGPFKYCSVHRGHQDMLQPLPLKSPAMDVFHDPSGVDERGVSIYASVVEFVENYLSLVYRRQVLDLNDTAWCPEWWRHAEAVVRLDALWRAWEHYRLEPSTGLSVWFLDHADPHMYKLIDQRGPFRYCNAQNGHQDLLGPLPLRPPPPELFRDITRDTADTVPGSAETSGSTATSGSAETSRYTDVAAFVENYLSQVYRRQVNDVSDTVWCPEWWKHAEAVGRLDALWRAWEHYRLDGRTGLSVWFLDHADPHMNTLIDQRGPFKYCSARKGHQDMLGPLPLSSPMRAMFADPSVADFDI